MITPIEYNVVVLPEKVDEKTAGGLYIPENKQDKDQGAAHTGTLVALSPMAFSFEEWPEDVEKPKAGDRVVFVRYAGATVESNGEEYRIIKDKDILGVLS
jgi:chaperonin GroES